MGMKLQSWQLDILDNMTKFKGRGIVQITGRQTGKSQMSAYMRLWNDIHNSGPVENLILSEGTVYGLRYYCAEPVGGNWLDMEVWCTRTFGETSSIWQETKNLTPEPNKRWYMNNSKFWFRNQADLTMFVMKWR